MKSLMALEIDNSLIERIYHSDDGYVVKMANNQVMFITTNKIGIFDNSLIDAVDGDFSKIGISTLHIIQQ